MKRSENLQSELFREKLASMEDIAAENLLISVPGIANMTSKLKSRILT